MDILFNSKKLAKRCTDDRTGAKAFGAQRARRLRQRLDEIDAAARLGDMRALPGRFHELKGDLKGKFSLDLDGPYRLILEPAFPNDPELDSEWAEATAVRIIGIEDTHG